jgi:hypothetical protein
MYAYKFAILRVLHDGQANPEEEGYRKNDQKPKADL